MEELLKKIKECESYASVGRLLGFYYYNAFTKKNILNFCKEHNIDIEKQLSDYKNRKTYCLNCGKEIQGENRLTKKFCCSSCSASYNNRLRQPKTEEEKKKISKSLIEYNKTHKRIAKTNNITHKTKVKLISDCINEGLILNPYNTEYKDKFICENKYSEKTCKVCGKRFKSFLNINGKLFKGETCSEKCHKLLVKEIGKNTYKRLVDEGRFKGWQSRNILSYPERFWVNVLNNNNIIYTPNKPLKHENSNYFLDFYIEIGDRKIDLEIDGKQHEFEDRAESDKKRDEYISECGIEIYRIKWNEINSEKGKKLMKEKIDDFLTFINR